MVDLRRAAFGDRPDLDVSAATFDPDPWRRWLAAVALGGQGRYAAATALLHPLSRHHDPVIAALAATALSSHRRQLGAHAPARVLDALALSRIAEIPPSRLRASTDPDSVDAAGARVDALLGLAADAIGLGRLTEARRLHEAATRAADPAAWRPAVRVGWVAAEIELASGRPDAAIHSAERVIPVAEEAPSTRHRAKSALVLGTALATADAPAATTALDRALGWASRFGLLPLLWPSALVRADLSDTGEAAALRRDAAAALREILRRSDSDGRLFAAASPWLPSGLLRSGDPP
ncbi:hypothetical protein GCM10012275_32250 [Longimycelium tulufanense]|uniref:Uncharacterized protein n=1 Tax=Longimycelium tulufanense TaxID=907463 RepID=A0A8J3CCF6_9PSEU|nr:hypothetical protein [Longimycelium tulufanense]GGM58630.1 hypothetical protein GCM10012275_32250 [Longimycelium tulufanense]